MNLATGSGVSDDVAGLTGGGAGNAPLSGGAAKDYFVYSAAGFGQDIITDFQDGLDKLKVHSSVTSNISAFGIASNGTTQVVLTELSPSAKTITLNDTTAINLTALDFQFYRSLKGGGSPGFHNAGTGSVSRVTNPCAST